MEETESIEPIQETLGKLIRLQELLHQLTHLKLRIAATPGEIARLAQEQENEKAQLVEARKSLDESAKQRRLLEGEVDSLRSKLSHLKTQLMSVKTNEAYHAMLREIAYVEGQIRDKEDEILDHMGFCEELERNLKNRNASQVERCRQLEDDKGRLEAFLQDAVGERSCLEQSVRELESVIEHGLLERFKRIAAARGGVALTTISNGSCEACHVRLRPQLIAEVRTHRDIILCENCSRILYYVPPPPAPSS